MRNVVFRFSHAAMEDSIQSLILISFPSKTLFESKAYVKFEDYREEFKESFPMLDEAKYFIRKPKAIEDLVNHVATILG
jgi:hypothetical protein